MLTSHELMGFMSRNLAMEILLYAHDNDKPLYKTTMQAVAESKKVRPVFFERQPRPARHETMLAALAKPNLELITGNLIRNWLLKKYQGMLVDFLDALQIVHKDGVVDDLPATMEDAKLEHAIKTLLAKYPHETVAVYLHAFNDMNEANWTNLKSLLEKDPQLQLGG